MSFFTRCTSLSLSLSLSHVLALTVQERIGRSIKNRKIHENQSHVRAYLASSEEEKKKKLEKTGSDLQDDDRGDGRQAGDGSKLGWLAARRAVRLLCEL